MKKPRKTYWFFKVFAPSDGAKNAPRSTQDAPKTVLKSYFFDVQNCDQFWSVLGSILGAFGEAFWLQKEHQKLIKFVSPSKGAPKRHQEGSKRAPRGPRSAPRGPKRHLREPQEAPRGPKRHPREPQENPRGTKKLPM